MTFTILKDRDNYGNILCDCICPFCGKHFTIRKSQIKGTKSCGCMKGNRKFNRYFIVGSIVVIFDSKGNSCLIDYDDFEKVKEYYWYCDSRGYWLHHIKRGDSIYLHKFVKGVGDDFQVDHIYHNLWDNRKSRLRPCSQLENLRNKDLRVKNKTGVVGVYPTSSGRYKANVYIKGREIRLGVFDTIEEAKYYRREAEKQYYGEFRGGRYV